MTNEPEEPTEAVPSDEDVAPTGVTFADLLTAPQHSKVFEWTQQVDRSGVPRSIASGMSIPPPFLKLPTPPPLTLYCDSDYCAGERLFSGYWPPAAEQPSNRPASRHYELAERFRYVVYQCRNCGQREIAYALRVDTKAQRGAGPKTLVFTKIGEDPLHRPPIPKAVQRFITGDDWEMYLKGRAAEIRGLGIGAFTYYRRVVENNWDKLLERLIEVATKTGDELVRKDLESAKGSWQFSNAVENVKHAIPAKLKIGSHNPLTLLHNAFSGGVHNLNDAECLGRAEDGRRVLEALLERMRELLSDHAELLASVQRLAQNAT